jgi:beta-lactamase class D
MVTTETDAYTLSGKTGWAVDHGKDFGWFVGFLEVGDAVYFVATNLEPDASGNLDALQVGRKLVSTQAFQALGFID